MFIIKPYIFQKFPEIIFGFSTKIGGGGKSEFDFNLSYAVGDDKSNVDYNRKLFFNAVGLDIGSVGFQRQIHSDVIQIINNAGNKGESDALITNKMNLGLAIIVADCTPIFLYDYKQRIIAAIHSGWRGTEQEILNKTLIKLKENFSTDPENLFVYIGPSISASNYEVGKEVAEKFNDRYITTNNKKIFLDISGINYDRLIEFGIPQNQIQKSELCTFEYSSLLHSYRRDGTKSGRSLGVIAIKG